MDTDPSFGRIPRRRPAGVAQYEVTVSRRVLLLNAGDHVLVQLPTSEQRSKLVKSLVPGDYIVGAGRVLGVRRMEG